MDIRDALSEVTISPYDELIAYEYLYAQEGSSLKTISKDTVLAHKMPSLVLREKYGSLVLPDDYEYVADYLKDKTTSFSVIISNTHSYPDRLMDSTRPTPLLYYRGDIGLLESKCISIVGTRKASPEGLRKAALISRDLVDKGFTIVSGLAKGIDTVALQTAMSSNGHVIGVIGTPIDEYYPKENKHLQDTVAMEHLLVSQVPIYRYSIQPFNTKRAYFPERNELMSAISNATIVIEASDTSGTLIQARACIEQNRPLFILRSCYESQSISWPKRIVEHGNGHVYVVDDVEDILDVINHADAI